LGLFVVATLLVSVRVAAIEAYLEPDAFLRQSFNNDVPKPSRLWITKPLRAEARAILDRDFNQLRVRYWQSNQRTVWILEEIGKERPITTGLIVDDNILTDVRVLIYRESRGFEVRFPYFTSQFAGARLNEDNELDRPIDGITGATMSVRALTKLARLALVLDRYALDEREKAIDRQDAVARGD
jgi:hypothetical protein